MEKRCIVTDSWFGSVKIDSAVGKLVHHAVLIIKSDHSRILKQIRTNYKVLPRRNLDWGVGEYRERGCWFGKYWLQVQQNKI